MHKEKENKDFNIPVEARRNIEKIIFQITDFFAFSDLSDHLENNTVILNSYLESVDFQDTSYEEVKMIVRIATNQNIFLANLYEQLIQYEINSAE